MEKTREEIREGMKQAAPLQLKVYVMPHCFNCDYAVEIAETVRRYYPHVAVQVIDLSDPQQPRPETVFATPTYLLNGCVWSLGNPSQQQIEKTFGRSVEHNAAGDAADA
uniref:Thioredoxin-like fold domain-containing protein n=1 Tax=Caldilinea aerophila TaxID=133453 RepID=A0A7C1FU13_9CHLR